ncbi:MAG: biotin--[acetyl-CoA-carboxylase] ligase [Saprospiraceae bacterium]|nr:biotin--[acetyl-CoA-carboxylase] ligase [Saprospiraceae bacterium]
MSTIQNTRLIGKVRKHYQSLLSTNDCLLEMVASGEEREGLLITTDYQEKGRGQHLKTWDSKPNMNVLLSFLVRPPSMALRQLFDLNRFVSLAVRKTIEDCRVLGSKVKWPNDVYIDDKKVAGILIQNSIRDQKIGNVVVGIGLNVNQQQWRADIPRATSLRLALGSKLDREQVLDLLLKNLDAYYQIVKEDPDTLKAAYHRHLYQRDKWSAYELANGHVIKGKIEGVDHSGSLMMQLADGTRKQFAHHEITFL